MTTPATPDALRATAFHESGHAVIGTLLGLAIATAVVNEDGSGITTPAPGSPKVSGLDNRTYLLAGPLAESFATGERLVLHRCNDHRDMRAADRAWRASKDAPKVGEDEGKWLDAVMIAQAVADAARLLHANWGTIERVAAALLARRKLSGAELAELMKAGD